MKQIRSALAAAIFGTAVLSAGPASADVHLVGSGASFPFPLYAAWFKKFSDESDGITVDYQSKGSGAGIQDLTNNVVDFAASDAAMSDEEIAKVKEGVVLLPMTAGEVVLAYNLEGVDSLKLPRDVYPEIFLGKIESWNDPKLVAANPGVDLPDEPITVVVRSDSSGTTFTMTNHLSAISEAFKNGPGVGKTVQWPESNKIVRAPKNDGVTATIKQTPGSIGYIEYTFAKFTNTPFAELENKAGNYVKAGAAGGSAALATAKFDSHMRAFEPDPPGPEAYPVTTFTWMLFYASGQSAEKIDALKKMVEFGLTEGQTMAGQYGYVPLPDEVITKVRTEMAKIK
ncbi:MAG: phosphate ABC transporter substrate-binding protein PstS [Pseudomonadota bacterium]